MNFRIAFNVLVFTIFFLSSCAQEESIINGISFVASPKEATQEHINPVLAINANHAAIMPFGFIKNLEHPEIGYNSDRQWFGETKKGTKQYIDILHQNNIEVMLKPQIWIWRGEYTGYLKMTSEEDWKILEDTYQKFILDFAEVAQESKVEIFCIGTELEQFIIHRPEYWNRLISEIRSIYDGKLTYAANWDEYKRVPFWKQLDYIGIDAYFPISEKETPTVEEAKVGWEPWKEEMFKISTEANKKIIFTEFGYRSMNHAGKEPWESDHAITDINLEAQSNLTTALFEEIWKEEWFAGGYLWKWFIKHKEVGGVEDNQFTPQNKPVENIVRTYYKIN